MRRTFVSMVTFMMIGVFIAASAFGAESPATAGPAMSCQGRMRHAPEGPMPIAIMMLVRCQEIDVLSELSGLTKENVRQLLISSQPPRNPGGLRNTFRGLPFGYGQADPETHQAGADRRHGHEEAGG